MGFVLCNTDPTFYKDRDHILQYPTILLNTAGRWVIIQVVMSGVVTTGKYLIGLAG